jgi:hypothetical protein
VPYADVARWVSGTTRSGGRQREFANRNAVTAAQRGFKGGLRVVFTFSEISKSEILINIVSTY